MKFYKDYTMNMEHYQHMARIIIIMVKEKVIKDLPKPIIIKIQTKNNKVKNQVKNKIKNKRKRKSVRKNVRTRKKV